MTAREPFRILEPSVAIDRLAGAVRALPAAAWRRDPDRPERSFVALAHRRGDHTDDRLGGVVLPTTWFDLDPVFAETIASFGVAVGRVRLVREPVPGPGTPRVHPFWAEHDVIRVSVDAAPGTVALIAGARVPIPPGTVLRHDGLCAVGLDVDDGGPEQVDAHHVHLEIATSGTLVSDDGRSGSDPSEFERVALSERDPPGRMVTRAGRVGALLGSDESAVAARAIVDDFVEQWRSAWVVRHDDPAGERFAAARRRLRIAVEELGDAPAVSAGVTVAELLLGVFGVGADAAERSGSSSASVDERFDRPVFVIGTLRSGIDRLGSALAVGSDVVSLDIGVRSFVVDSSGRSDSDRVARESMTDRVAGLLRDEVFDALHDRHGAPLPRNASGLRLVDTDPRHAVCIEMLDRVFPDARFVVLVGDPRVEIAELRDLWAVAEPGRRASPAGWDGPHWRSVVPPGWSGWAERDPLGVAARQWEAVASAILDDLDRVAPGRWTAVDHDVLVARPRRELRRVLNFAGLDTTIDELRLAPIERHRMAPFVRPLTDDEWGEVAPVVADTADAIRRLADVRPGRRRAIGRRRVPDPPGGGVMVELLGATGASLVVAGQDQGALLVVGSDGDRLRIESVALPGVRSVASLGGGQIVAATQADVHRFRQHRVGFRAVGADPEALYVMRSTHHTGMIGVREMAFDADGELWLVASRYSCLATLDDAHSFVPRWVPPFVHELAGDDRCHLNGLAVRDGRPRYVTAYSESDVVGGWRDTKTFGGVVVDVETDEVIVRGMCMPHSPRWHRDALWVLESGSGRLGRVDLEAGRFEPVVDLPGFARGLALVGRYAVVATSSLRSHGEPGVPLADGERPTRVCLVVVDLDEGRSIGVLPLRSRLSQIHDVQVVPWSSLHVAAPGSEHHLHSVVVPPTKWVAPTDA